MRSKILGRYFLRILLFSGGYYLAILCLDVVFNGFVLDTLAKYLDPIKLYYVSRNREEIVLLVYIAGLLLVSGLYVLRLGKLLVLVGDAVEDEQSAVYTENCPAELQTYGRRMKEFRFALRQNEQARELAERQKNDLIVYLAHDLKTPLTSVIGYLSLLEENPELTREQKGKYTAVALDKAYRLEQLINEFFEITRMNLQAEALQKTKVNVTILLNQIMDEFYPMLAEKQLGFTAQIQPELIVNADVDKLARVLDNLFRNAINYSSENTEIMCRAFRLEKEAVISLQNRGEHISQEKLARIFDKFYRVDNARSSATGGSGLGLAISKQIVELHGGTITADSRDGVTEFRVILPV